MRTGVNLDILAIKLSSETSLELALDIMHGLPKSEERKETCFSLTQSCTAIRLDSIVLVGGEEEEEEEYISLKGVYHVDSEKF